MSAPEPSESTLRSPSPDRVDALVVGVGVVGLACARALAQAGLEVVIVERETQFGSGVSARNSEVVHAGLYNPPGSLKSRLCVRGARLLTDYCAQRGVAHRRCGKLLVATREADVGALESLAARARDNGVEGLQRLTRAQAVALEVQARALERGLGKVPAIAHKGVYRWRCCIKGKPAHSSLTPQGVNAVEIACEFVAHLKSMHRQLVSEGPFDPIYDVPHTTIHTGVIHGGTALNIIPRDCDVTWEIRHHHMNSPEALFAQAKAFADSLVPAMQAVAADTGITHKLNSVLPGFATDADSEIARLCFTCAGSDSSSGAGKVSFGTEAALFHQAGVPTIVCGPGHIAQAHQPNEWVELTQLAWCERFMRRLADQICVN